MRGVGRLAALTVAGLACVALLGEDLASGSALFAQPAQNDGPAWIARVVAATPANAIVVAPWTYATTLAYGAYVLHALGDRIVLTSDAQTYRSRYRTWLAERPVVVVSDDPLTIEDFRLHDLDADGTPHLYALR
jgi:hypothetical protein